MKRGIVCWIVSALLLVEPASAQLAGGLLFPGPGTVHTVYQGPGDIVSPSGFSSGQRTSMNTNMHGANGYNF